ncbi:MAG: division/cell wall cluster transcriptional repressor MraZ [Firmicutes bacterium]|nr:division/cell wall cluster transcriptional repressor MraZ [Bacillota bacterium]
MGEKSGNKKFFGEHRYQIDEKQRIRLPSKFKELLGEEPVFICGPGKCILVYHPDAADKAFDEMFGSVKLANDKKNTAMRKFGSLATEIAEDKQGRFVLPGALVKHAEIKRNLVVVGAIYRAEIWSEENWEKESDMSPEAFDGLFDALDEHNEKRIANNE